ncbi:hypothetical protein SAMN05216570_1148 [Dyella sp. OK004]|nr:hypothetical protein SAMN05216570_1148 [Dyella sp. OK004]
METTKTGSNFAPLSRDAMHDLFGESAAPLADKPPLSINGLWESGAFGGGSVCNHQTTEDPNLTLTGTIDMSSPWVAAMAGNLWVKVLDDGVEIGRFRITEGTGFWEFDLPSPLSLGEHHLTVQLGDSPVSNAFDITEIPHVPVEVPDIAPTITHVVDAPNHDVGQDGATGNTRPLLIGNAAPGSWVTIMDGATVLGKVKAGLGGTWMFTDNDYRSALGDGPHHLAAVSDSGNASAAYDFNIDTTPPPIPAPEITYVVDGPNHDLNHGTTDNTRPLLIGTAAPSSWVTIMDGTTILGKVKAGPGGAWMFTDNDYRSALGDGTHHLSAVSDSGNVSAVYDFNVATTPVQQPTPQIDYVFDAQGYNLGQGGTTVDTHPRVMGHGAAPNSWVTIKDGEIELGKVQADSAGNWTLDTYAASLGDGPHHLVAVSADGNASAPFDINVHVIAAPVIDHAYGETGGVETAIGADGKTDDRHPRLEGSAEPNSWVTIRDGLVEIGRVQADDKGHWVLNSSDYKVDLSNGAHHLVAVSDSHTNSAPVDFTVDTTPPAEAPFFIGAQAGDDQIFLYNTDKTDETRLTFFGKGAEPGATVTIMEDGHVIGTAKASPTGAWMFAYDAAVTDGFHHFTAQVGDGPVSKPFDVAVATAEPHIITVYDSNIGGYYNHDGISTTDSTPRFTGEGPKGSVVTLIDVDSGKVLGTTTVNTQGLWSIEPSLGPGEHHLRVEADNGKVSSTDFDIRIESTPSASSQAEGHSLSDVLAAGEGDLFATDHGHDNAMLSVHDVEPTTEGMAVNGSNAPTHDVSTLNANLVLPHEQAHTHAVM